MSRQNTVATNIRFNLDKPEDREAWEHLRHLDKQEYPSYSKLVIQLINEHYRHKAMLDADPYLETREKEDAFLQRVMDTIQSGMTAAVPTLMVGSLLNMMQTSGTGQAPSIRSDTEDDAADEDVDTALGFLNNF